MTSNFVTASIKKDLARWWRNPVTFLLWLGIPFLVGGLMTAMIGGGAAPTGLLLIADLDETPLSGIVAGAYTQGQLGELITVEQVTVDEGRARVDAGEASAFLTIPRGFQNAFLDAVPVVLTLETNPSQTILPAIITDVTEILLDAGFYAEQLFGAEIDKLQASASGNGSGDPADPFVAEIAVDIQNKISAVAPMLFPPILELEIAASPPEEPPPDYGVLFLPGIVMMAILFAANGLAGDFWVERDAGTLRRLVSSPGRLSTFVAGKALAALLVVAAIAGLTLAVGFLYHGLGASRYWPSLMFASIAGVGLFAWFAALQMLFANQKAAGVFTTILLFPLLMAGGSFFPLATLPDWIAAIGRLSPNGFVADKLTTEITAGGAGAIALQDWLVLVVTTVAGLAASTWRLRAGFARR